MKIIGLQRELKKKNIDFALFLNLEFDIIEPNIFYFSNYGGIGALVIPKSKKPFLVVPAMEFEKAKNAKLSVFTKPKGKRLTEIISALLKKRKIKHKKIGIDTSFVTLNVHKSIKKALKKTKAADISNLCLKLREIKAKEEIGRIRKACMISDKILNNFFKNFRKFKTEAEAKAFLEFETKKNNCELAFKPIVASGSNSRIPHSDTDGKIKKGFCVIDFGIKHKGYCSDTTRTIYFGKISKKEKELYYFLLNVQTNLIKKIKEGMKCSYLYDESLKLLKKYKNNFTHGLGHGLGIKIHELPNITDKSKDILKKNMVFTIEPGIYLKKSGIRIEDTILLNKKAIILTKTPKDLLVIS